jgi:hypothetical protein
MDLTIGFQLDDPRTFIPWEITQADLQRCLGNRLRKVTHGYFTISCSTLNGMSHELGFHFEPRHSDHLTELEFFRRSYRDQVSSFRDFQTHFEEAFGPPTRQTDGTEGFPSYEWVVPGARIVHFVIDRFGPEEHMRVQRVAP